MIRIDRILCPLDFSDVSRRALDHAVALAGRRGASLLALHVVPLATPMPMAPAPVYPAATMPPDPQVRRSMLDELEQAVEPARRAGVSVETIVREGDAVRTILHEAERLPIDLVVMGTHGLGGFERLVMGSVAEKLVRKAPCPVLTVAPPAENRAQTTPIRYDRVLCPVDFSDTSTRALEYGLSLAESPRSEVTLLHVVEEAAHSFLPPEKQVELAELQRGALEEVERRLQSLLPSNVRDFCTPRVVARRGRTYEQILALAQEQSADVIVLGVRGHGLVERLLLGSVTSRVVRSAECPVLTVRPTARGAVGAETEASSTAQRG